MSFERIHKLTLTSTSNTAPWQALLSASQNHQLDPNPYTYVYVEKSPLPETLRVWRDGSIVFTSVTNTGVGIDNTHQGTWPIFERLVTATMKGINPNGTHYVDHGIPWVSYFHGSIAVHGYNRAQYGFPQSAGCVELPISNADIVYHMVHIGTLVTVL
ncbi:MAG: L,D-transpeptidase [Ferrimicrobium sp.]